MKIFLAALRGASDDSSNPQIRDIVPPVDPPYSLWMLILLGACALAALALAVFLIIQYLRRRPAPPPPTPRAIALKALERLREQVRAMDPYNFSIAVSDVLRHFVGEQFQLKAEKQTSPEFLASIGRSRAFTMDERELLADFLERCDLIKFARIDANTSTSEALLKSAFDFVEGARA
jgi:hypothetical protein